MWNRTKRILAWVLTFVMLFSFSGVPVSADDEGGEIPVEEDTVEIKRDGYTISAPSIGDLIDEVEDGDTITLIANTDTYGTVTIPEGISVTIDLAGYTLDETIVNYGTITFTDSSGDGTGVYTGTLTNDGTLTIKGGTYNFDVSNYLAERYTYTDNWDGTYTVLEQTTAYVATVTDKDGNVTYYETLADAAEYANSLATGKSRITTTITLLKDITLTEQVALTNSATTVGDYLILDLNGYTITSDVADGYALYLGSSGTSGKVTVQNGTINATANAYGAIEIENEAAILTSLTLTSQTARHGTILVDSVYGSYVAFTDLIINTTDGYCIETAAAASGNISLSGTNTFAQTASAGSAESQVNACFYLSGNGVKFTAGSSATLNLSSDGYGAYITGSDRLVLQGAGTISGKVKGIYVGSSYGGTYSALEVSATSTIAVNGGVTSDAASYSNGAISISGGNYEFDLDDSYVASGYECVLDSDTTSDTYGRYIINTVVVAEVYNGETLVGSYNSLSGAVSASTTKSGYTVKLVKDCTGSSTISVTKNLTIDLNGCTYTSSASTYAFNVSNTTTSYTLTIKDSSTTGGGAIVCGSANAGIYMKVGKLIVQDDVSISCTNGYGIYVGGYTAAYTSAKAPTVTIQDNANIYGGTAGIAVYGDTKGTGSYGPTVNVTGGTVSGGLYGIAGNGTTSNPGQTFINISGGTVQGLDESDSIGIYHPQVGTLTVTGGTISGYSTGIEIRAGKLNVSGGTIFASAGSTSYVTNGNGTTVIGAGIAVSQHSTNKELTVNITGGEISGATGIYEVNTYAGTNTSAVTINISEADESTPTVVRATNTGNKAVYSESISGATSGAESITTIAISGGHFTSDLANTLSYIADGYTAYTEEESTTYYTDGIPYTVGAVTSFNVTYIYPDGTTSDLVKEITIGSDSCYNTNDGTYDLTAYVPSGYLYGGLYTDGDLTIASGENCGVAFTYSSADTNTYYVKLVSDSYFRIKCVAAYDNDNLVQKLWPITGIDSVDYESYGFIISGADKTYEVSTSTAYNTTTMTIEVDGKTYTQEVSLSGLFEDLSTGYLGVVELDSDALAEYTDSHGNITLTIHPYFVTLDGVKVTGIISRSLTFTGGYADAHYNGYEDTEGTSTTSKYTADDSDDSDDDSSTETNTTESIVQTMSLRSASLSTTALTAVNTISVLASTASGSSTGTTAVAVSGSDSGTAAVNGGLNVEDTYVINTVTFVAQLTHGELNAQYTTLEAAFSAAADGDTITLLSDVTITDAVYYGDGYFQVSGKEVTLDLDGYTLSVDTTRILGVKNGGTLNVKNGTIEIAEGTSASYSQFNMVRGNSTFTAADVTFKANSIGGYAVYIAAGAVAKVEMTDCTFSDLKNAVVFDADNVSTVTLTGCTYDKQPFSTKTFSTVENYTVVITDKSPTDSGYEFDKGYTLFFNYVIEDGGKIETSTISLSAYFGGSSLTVKDGGTITANVKVNDNTSMTVEGGTVTGIITVAKEGEAEAAAISEESEYTVTGGLMTISGGTVTGQVKSSGTLIMTGGTVTDDGETGYADGVVYILNGNVYVSGGAVTGTKRGFGFAGSGTISGTITGGSITGSDIALMVRANSDNTVKVSGGSYTAAKALYLAKDEVLADCCGAYNTEGTLLNYTTSGIVKLYKSALSDQTVVIGPTSITLGVSSDETASVSASVAGGYGRDTMYAMVETDNMTSYSTTAYPITSLTFTDEDGTEHTYIFAGWYEDNTGNTPCTSSMWDGAADAAEYYAKFVDADVLTVDCVYTPSSITGSGNAWRFLSSMDSLNYEAYYFVVGGDSYEVTTASDYHTIQSVEHTFYPSDFSSASTYVMSYGFLDSSNSDTYSVSAAWKTFDGTMVYGETYTFTAADSSAAVILTGSVSE